MYEYFKGEFILHNDLQQLEEEKQGHGTVTLISNGRGHV